MATIDLFAGTESGINWQVLLGAAFSGALQVDGDTTATLTITGYAGGLDDLVLTFTGAGIAASDGHFDTGSFHTIALALGSTPILSGTYDTIDATATNANAVIDAASPESLATLFYTEPTTINGSTESEAIYGPNAFASTINGGAGHDDLQGGGQGDLLVAGNDGSSLSGFEGNDTLQGGNGNDVLDGGIGDDSITAGGGNDTIVAGAGHDDLDGGSGFDRLVLAADRGGADINFNGEGNGNGYVNDDPAPGDPAAQMNSHFASIEQVIGNAGVNDITLTGGATVSSDTHTFWLDGNNYHAVELAGGAGNDSFDDATSEFDGGSGQPFGSSIINYGLEQEDHTTAGTYGDDAGERGVIVNMSTGALEIDSTLAAATGQTQGTLGDENVDKHALDTYGDTDQINGVHAFDLTDANDYFTAAGSSSPYSVSGEDGNDTLIGGTGNDRFQGGGGNDSIVGGGGNDNIDGGDGDDTITVGDGIPQGNYIQGSYISGGRGNDSMQGGNGDDSFRIGPGHDNVDGGGSYDSVQFDDENPGNRIDVIFSGLSSGTVSGTFDSSADAPDDTIDTTFTSIDQVRGSSGADTFTAASDAVADSDSTTFQLKVEDGNGGHNEDFRAFTVSGEAGNDLFDGGGEHGNNDGHGSFFVNYQQEENQGTHGNIGNVYGDDPGEEGVVINLSNGDIDTANDGIATATRQDEVTVAAGTALDTFGDTDTITGVHAFRLTDTNDYFTAAGTNGQYNVEAGNGDDTIIGGLDRDWIHGGDGNDYIDGGGSADDLDGGEGNDTLIAGEGIDHGNNGIQGTWFNGGRGDDSVVGNNGGDYFVGGSGQDTIIGGSGNDQIAYENEGDVDHTGDNIQVTFAGEGNGSIVGSYGGEDVGGDDPTTFTSIERVRGTAGDDSFTATDGTRASNDADTFNLHDVDDNDGDDQYRTIVVSGGDGADSFVDDSGARFADDSSPVGVLTVDYSDEQWQHDNVGNSYGDNLSGGDTPVTNYEPGVVLNLREDDGTVVVAGSIATGTGRADPEPGNEVTLNASSGLDTYDSIDTFGGSTGVHSFRLTDAGDYVTAQGSTQQYSIEGHDGNDTIIGGVDRDKLRGDDGDDSLVGGGGRDDLDGGNGADTLDATGGSAPQDDHLEGSWLRGGAGSDLIIGSDGNDYFVGGSGHDTIQGNGGNDVIAYENENDNDGHPGDPHAGDGVAVTFTSGQGNGTINGFYGAHWVPDVGAEHPDQDGAWVADDVLSTFTSIERFKGTTGADTIEAAANATPGDHVDTFQLKVEDGNGGHNEDFSAFVVSGGAGNDIITAHGDISQYYPDTHGQLIVSYEEEQWMHNNVGDTFGDGVDGNGHAAVEDGVVINLGTGGLNIAGDIAGATHQVATTVAVGTALDTYGNTDTLSGVHAFRLTNANDYFTAAGTNVQYNVEAGQGDDTIFGGTARDWIHGGDGNDYIDGGGSADDLDGGDGDDTLIAGAGIDRGEDQGIQGSWFNGGRGNDSMVGNNGGDYFVGGSGHDIITGADGNDQIAYENDNNDEGYGGLPHEHDGVTVTFTSGQGNGTITGLYGSTWDPAANGGDGAWVADDVDSTFTSIEVFKGTTGDDTIVTQADSDPGDDTNTFELKVEDGNGGHNEDFHAFKVSGGAGNDVITANGVVPDADVDSHGQIIVDYNDEQWMHDNVGEVFGDGEDGNGDPATENGVVINLSNSVVDTATGGIATATHQDVVTVAAGTALDTYGDTDTITGVHAFRLTDTNDYFTAAGTNVQYNIEAGHGADTIVGSTARDWIHGDDGNDYIDGGGSADDLDGGDGDDTMIAGVGIEHGSPGDDDYFVQGTWFNGGRGDDSMVGNNGGDYFVLGSGHDTIIGGGGQDQISWERNDGDGQNHTADAMVVTFNNSTDANGDSTPDGAASGTITGSSGAVAVDIKFSSIEQIRGTNNADTFTAAANATVDPDSSDNFYLTDPAHPNDDGQRHAIRVVGNAGGDTFTDNTTGFGGILKIDYNDEAYQHDNVGDGYGDDPGENGVIINFSGSNKTVDSTLHTATGQATNTTITSGHGLDTYGNTDSYVGNVHAFSLTDARDVFYGGTAGYSLNMNGGNDTFIGGAGSDNVDGGDGDDSLSGGGGSNEWLGGGSGNDTLVGGATGSFNLDGNDGNDSLVGTGGDGWMGGGSGNDVLIAGNGHVDMDGGGGDDTVTGGTGSNYISVKGGNAVITGGDGTNSWDELSFNQSGNSTSHIAFTVTGAGSGTISGNYVDTDNPDDSGAVSGTFTGIEDAVGSSGDDTFTISGTAGGDADGWTRHGASGDDQIFAFVGGAGNDTFTDTTGRPGGSSVINYEEEKYSHPNNNRDFGTDPWGSHPGEHGVVVNLTGGVVTEGVEFTSDAVDPNATVGGGTAIDTFGDTDTIVGVQVFALTTADDAFFAGNSAFGYQADGRGGNDTLVGGTGNDTLESGGGNDKLTGGAGNDVFIITNATGSATITDFADGSDKISLRGFSGISSAAQLSIVDGAGGADITIAAGTTVHVTGVTAANLTGADFLFGGITGTGTIDGTLSDDVITGSGVADTIRGLAGSDLIQGLGGNDVLIGDFNSTVVAGAGNDTLDGGAGTDTMSGGAGNDTYIVDSATDVVNESQFGGAGIDTVISSVNFSLADTTHAIGSIENLTLASGAAAALSATGNTLDNVIVGNEFANTLTGGAGNDTLDGGTGADSLVGGVGNDVYIVDNAGDVANDSAGGGTGTDTVQSSVTFSLGDTVHAVGSIENLTLTGSSNINGTGNTLANVITGNSGNNSLDGGTGTGADTLSGGAGVDTLTGGDGSDIYILNIGDDDTDIVVESNSLAAGGAADEVRSSLSAYTLTANVERLTLMGTGDINGFGNTGNNTITGNAGANVIDGAGGADSMVGGDGSDSYFVDNAGDAVVETNTIKATGGDDTVMSSINYTLTANVENLILITGGTTGTGNALNNVISASTSGNTLDGGAGADTMVGAGGADTFIVDNALDVVTGDDGIDVVKASLTFSLVGLNDVENLTLTGTGNFNATGNDGNNTITGNGGNNSIDGGLGADSMVGGAGNDTYVVDNAGDVVNESLNSGAGTDLAQASVTFSLNTLDLQVIGTVENLTLTGIGDINGTGSGTSNVITGNSGNNSLDGGAGNDTLIGGGGNDILNGGSGNDSMVGGAGNDTYFVDSATDAVSESPAGGTDTIVASISFSLNTAALATIENLTLTGSASTGTGNALNNVIDASGSSVAHTLNGGTGTDSLYGGTGNDTYVVDDATDVVDETSGGGIDTVQFSGSSGTLTIGTGIEQLTLTSAVTTGTVSGIGNEVANVMTGNGAANSLSGLGGDDSLSGGGGADTLFGGDGNDTLDGGSGSDTLVGGDGDDTYRIDVLSDVVSEAGTDGTDTVTYSGTVAGSYVLSTDVENFTILAATNLINVTGNGSNNTIIGGAGSNSISGGGAGDDSLFGAGGNDTLIGGTGSDTLDGGAGTDSMVGGDGNDLYILDVITDVVVETGSTGGDEERYSGAAGTLSMAAGVEIATLTGVASTASVVGNELDNVITGSTGSNSLTGGAGSDTLNGGGGNDTLDGGTGTDSMNGGTGNDTYIVDSASDVINDAGGTDTVITTFSYTLTDGSGIENLTLKAGAAGAITATGNSIGNLILGNAFDNTIDGGGAADTMQGGAGNDTYYVDNSGDVVNESFNGGAGNDTIVSDISFSLADAVHAIGAVENLTLTAAAGAGATATGNTLANVLTGNNLGNTLSGGTGADTMNGGTGNDTYFVDNASDQVNDTVSGGGGTDTVSASVSYTLVTGNGVENLTLTGAATVGTGNELANTILGTSAANTLNGGLGADTLQGGAGNDVYVVDNVGDVVNESLNGGAGTDTVQSSVSFSLADGVHAIGSVENLTLTGTAAINGTGNALVNVITGNAASNILDGGANTTGVDTLVGGAGNDVYMVRNAGDVVTESVGGGTDTVHYFGTGTYLLGANVENLVLEGSGNINGTGSTVDNLMTGNAGINILNGGAGNDTLDGGGGGDSLIGGLGDDTYIVRSSLDHVNESLSSGAGTDTVLSYVDFSLNTADGQVTAGVVENLTLLGTDDIDATGNTVANQLIGNSGANSIFGDAGNDFLFGGDGDDTLDGGTGHDQLFGGNGNDTFVYTDADFGVTATPGSGSAAANSDTLFDYSSGDSLDLRGLISTADIGLAGDVNGAIRIVGSNGAFTIELNEGATLHNQATPDWSTAFNVYGGDPDDITIKVGDGVGTTYHWNGSSFV